jgi:Xaa-Pro aminopeptidase
MKKNERLGKLRELLRKRGIGAFLITDPVGVEYISGFTGGDSYAFILPKDQYILTDGRYTEMAQDEAPGFDVLTRKLKMVEIIEKVVRKHRLKEFSFEGFSITYDALRDYRKTLGGGVRWKPERPVIHTLRRIKDAGEVARITKCVEVAEASMSVVRKRLKAGATESEVAAELEYQMRKRGGIKPSFGTIVAAGAHSSQPHAAAGPRKLRAGDAVTIDWGVKINGYNSDLTRVFFIGKVQPKFRRIYKIVLQAQRMAIAALKPGVPAMKLDAVARDHIARNGYGPQFSHSLGHGLGMEVHEFPILNKSNKLPLEAGMVVTIEPGIYIPGFGGVRVEDDVLVTDKGAKVLGGFPKELDEMIV